MAEIKLPPDEMPVDPDLLPVQESLKEQADEILAFKGKHALFFEAKVDVDPVELQARLRDSVTFPTLGRIMLANGDSLSAVPPNERQRDLDLFVVDESLKAVSVRGWGIEYPKSRFVTVGDEGERDNFVVFDGETDWDRRLTIKLHYDNGLQRAMQTLSLETSSENAGQLPGFYRDVIAPAYAVQGYNGHNEDWRQAETAYEASQFVYTVGRLFAQRIED